MSEESDNEPVRPMRFSDDELSRVGIRIIDRERIWLRCLTCDEGFIIRRDADGRLPEDYWECPNGCNAAHVDAAA